MAEQTEEDFGLEKILQEHGSSQRHTLTTQDSGSVAPSGIGATG